MTDLSRGARVRRGGRRPGWVLLTALLVLAIGASSALVFTNRVELLKLAVILALWAAVVAAFVSVIYRRQSDVDQARARDLKLVYDLQLDREISARREYELTVESQLRRELASELRAHAADEVSALRAELAALRTNLEILFDAELSERPALETERRTVRGYSDWDRENESARERVNRVTSVRAEEPAGGSTTARSSTCPRNRWSLRRGSRPRIVTSRRRTPTSPPALPEASGANRAAEPYEAAEADRGAHRRRATETLEPSRSSRRRRRVGPRRGHHPRAGPSGSLRAVAGLSRSNRRRPWLGCASGASPASGGERYEPQPARRSHRRPEAPPQPEPQFAPPPTPPEPPPEQQRPEWSPPAEAPAVKKRRPAGSRSAPKDSGCPPEHLAATGPPIGRQRRHGALGTTTPRPATALRSARPASANPRRRQRRRLSGGAGIPAPPSRPARSANPKPTGASRAARAGRHSAENSAYSDPGIGGSATPAPAMSPPPPPMPPSPPSTSRQGAGDVAATLGPPPAARHRSTDPLDTDAPPSGGQSVAELLARLQTSPSGGGRRRRRED